MNLRDFAAAGADLDRALAIVPDLALARATRSSVRLYLDDPTGALEDADWVIGNYSERGGRYNRLYVRLYSHEYDLAIEDSTWFVDRPDEVQKLARSLGYPAETVMADFLAYRGYAQLLKSQGGGGFDDMARSIETQPLRARAYIWRAHGYVLRSDLASAQTDLDAAVSNFQ